MRGDVDGYLAEFNPTAPIYSIWYPEWKNVKVWRDDRQRPDHARPGQAAAALQGRAEAAAERPSADPARRRSRSTRSCASASRACTSRSTTSTRASATRCGSTRDGRVIRRPGGAPSRRLSRPDVLCDHALGRGRIRPQAHPRCDPDAVRDLDHHLPDGAPAARRHHRHPRSVATSRRRRARSTQAREQLGLTGSYPEQYWRWISDFVQGDFGFSLPQHRARLGDPHPRACRSRSSSSSSGS